MQFVQYTAAVLPRVGCISWTSVNTSFVSEVCWSPQSIVVRVRATSVLETLGKLKVLTPHLCEYCVIFGWYTISLLKRDIYFLNSFPYFRLLSKPSVWLPEEHKRVLEAKKAVRKYHIVLALRSSTYIPSITTWIIFFISWNNVIPQFPLLYSRFSHRSIIRAGEGREVGEAEGDGHHSRQTKEKEEEKSKENHHPQDLMIFIFHVLSI